MVIPLVFHNRHWYHSFFLAPIISPSCKSANQGARSCLLQIWFFFIWIGARLLLCSESAILSASFMLQNDIRLSLRPNGSFRLICVGTNCSEFHSLLKPLSIGHVYILVVFLCSSVVKKEFKHMGAGFGRGNVCSTWINTAADSTEWIVFFHSWFDLWDPLWIETTEATNSPHPLPPPVVLFNKKALHWPIGFLGIPWTHQEVNVLVHCFHGFILIHWFYFWALLFWRCTNVYIIIFLSFELSSHLGVSLNRKSKLPRSTHAFFEELFAVFDLWFARYLWIIAMRQ